MAKIKLKPWFANLSINEKSETKHFAKINPREKKHFFRHLDYQYYVNKVLRKKLYYFSQYLQNKNSDVVVLLETVVECIASFRFFNFFVTLFFFVSDGLSFKSLLFTFSRKEIKTLQPPRQFRATVLLPYLFSYRWISINLWPLPVNQHFRFMGWSDEMKYIQLNKHPSFLLIHEN